MRSRIVIIVLLLLTTSLSSLYSQSAIAIRGGGGYSSVRFNPTEESGMLGINPIVGLSYRYRGGDDYVGAVQIDLNYNEKGYKLLPRLGSDSSYQRSVQMIELPFLWQPYIPLFNRKAFIFFNVGPYASMILGSSEEQLVSNTNGVLWSVPYDFNTVKDNRFEYGLLGGGGISVKAGRFEIFTEFRYVYGFGDLIKNSNKYPDSYYKESAMDQLNLTFGLYYNIFRKKLL